MRTKIRKVGKLGRGVIATKNFKKGQLVESSHTIIIPRKQFESIAQKNFATVLSLYVFKWSMGAVAIALGNGSLFNHKAVAANVTYKPHPKSKTIKFHATRDIKKGEQLFINYGYTMARAKKWYTKHKVK